MVDAEYLLAPFSLSTQECGLGVEDIHIFRLGINSSTHTNHSCYCSNMADIFLPLHNGSGCSLSLNLLPVMHMS